LADELSATLAKLVTMKNTTVLISGASIAGPALAYWLNRYGCTVTVVEKAPGLGAGGQAVDLKALLKMTDTFATDIELKDYPSLARISAGVRTRDGEPGA
jgi:flavin-dependent dehydrogenase